GSGSVWERERVRERPGSSPALWKRPGTACAVPGRFHSAGPLPGHSRVQKHA
ncbi:hypothetical protein KI387_031319, partial [Taxus chinensis]